MAGENATDRKCETAFKTVLDVALDGVPKVNIGFTESFKTTPFVAVMVTEATEAIFGTGTRTGQVEFAITSDADKNGSAPADHHARVGAVTDVLYDDGLIAALNAAGVVDFTMHKVKELSSRAGMDDRRFVTRITLECIYSGSSGLA